MHSVRVSPGGRQGGPPGVTVTGGVPKPTEVVSYWPALISKDLVQPLVGIFKEMSMTVFFVQKVIRLFIWKGPAR